MMNRSPHIPWGGGGLFQKPRQSEDDPVPGPATVVRVLQGLSAAAPRGVSVTPVSEDSAAVWWGLYNVLIRISR